MGRHKNHYFIYLRHIYAHALEGLIFVYMFIVLVWRFTTDYFSGFRFFNKQINIKHQTSSINDCENNKVISIFDLFYTKNQNHVSAFTFWFLGCLHIRLEKKLSYIHGMPF